MSRSRGLRSWRPPGASVLSAAALLMLFTPAAAPARGAADGKPGERPAWCATDITGPSLAWARHRRFQRRLQREGAELSAGGSGLRVGSLQGPTVTADRGVAVIEDDGSLVASPNPFDLESSAVAFQRRGRRLRAVPSRAPLGGDPGERLALGDDDSLAVDLPFSFPFFGRRWNRVFVNSDGNLTFGSGDSQSSPRSLARALSGPPRIAPLFNDLDPSRTSGSAGVFGRVTGGAVRFTWVDVPEFGASNRNTFQVTLSAGGRIEMVYGQIDAPEGILGVAPGGTSPVELLDFSADLPFGPSGLALLERFATVSEVDDFAVAQTFFTHFRDDYDHLVVWLDFPQALRGAFAFELNVRNRVQGIGLPLFDFSDLAGSDGRLESYLQMGSLGRYPADPGAEFLGTNSTLDILGQEAGHRWLAFVRYLDSSGRLSSQLLGRDFSHWSFFHDSDASVMEGNDIRDNGDGTFTTVGATSRFSRLDRYLMGLVPPEQVPPFFFVDQGSNFRPESEPQIGATFRGTRVDVSIDQVIAAEGPRDPASADAPKTFKMAFVLLARQGQPPTAASVSKVAKIRKRWSGFFRRATGGSGRVVTRLRRP